RYIVNKPKVAFRVILGSRLHARGERRAQSTFRDCANLVRIAVKLMHKGAADSVEPPSLRLRPCGGGSGREVVVDLENRDRVPRQHGWNSRGRTCARAHGCTNCQASLRKPDRAEPFR